MVMTMMFEDEDESMRTIPIAMTLALSSKESEYELFILFFVLVQCEHRNLPSHSYGRERNYMLHVTMHKRYLNQKRSRILFAEVAGN